MLDEILQRKDVQKMILDICKSECYFKKEKEKDLLDYQLFTDIEQIIFLFYDSLFKYKIIINDMEYFEEYLEKLDKLIRKIDNFQDIKIGISRILARLVSEKLELKDITSSCSKKKIIKYIYNEYVINGYYIHGYSTIYYNDIKDKGFIPEEYNNLYEDFIKIKKIFKKHNYDLIDKDFNDKSVLFTDSFIKGCYYSVNSPLYFYKLLCKNEFVRNKSDIESYSRNDYKNCYKNLVRLCDKLNFRDKEKKFIYSTFNKEWQLLRKEKGKISLILIQRRLIEDGFCSWENYYNEKDNIGVLVNNIINTNNDSILVDKKIDSKYIKLVNLDFYNILKSNSDVDNVYDKTLNIEFDEFSLNNDYGKVSILILFGSLFVTLGVIISVIACIGG